jgi:HEAT repeat protein
MFDRCRLVPVVLLAVFAMQENARCQEPESAALLRLRQTLRTTYPTPAERQRAIQQCLSQVRSFADLQGAVALVTRREFDPDEQRAAIERADQSTVREWFDAAVRHFLRQGDVLHTLEMLSRLAGMERAAAAPLTMVSDLAPDLADLALRGPPPFRGPAAHTLAQIEPPMPVAVPALSELLRTEDAQLRFAAADSFALLLQNSLQKAGRAGAVLQPAPCRELVLTASTIVPAVRAGLEDVRPEVRRRCLETIGLACAALAQLLDAPSAEGASVRRTPQAEAEELRPLLLALRDQGPMLTRCLHDNDPQMRILTHKALEDLGTARGRWLARCAAQAQGMEETLLAELLAGAMPGLAEELTHPDVRVRRSALDVLETSGSLALPALPALTRALNDSDRFVRWSAVRTVGKLGPSAAPQTVPNLTRLLHDPDVELRKAAANALTRLNAPP